MAKSYRALLVARGDDGVGYTKDFLGRQRQQRIARRFGGLRVGIANHNQVAHLAPSRSRAAMGALVYMGRYGRAPIAGETPALPSPTSGRRNAHQHPRRGRRVHLTSGLHR